MADPRALSEIYGGGGGASGGGGTPLFATDPQYADIIDIASNWTKAKNPQFISLVESAGLRPAWNAEFARKTYPWGGDESSERKTVQDMVQALGWGTATDPGAPTDTGGETMFGQLDPTLMQFLGKYGVTPASNTVPASGNIFSAPGTVFDQNAATQRGIFG